MVREEGGDREFFIYLLIHSEKLTYLQLLTVLQLPKVGNKVT